MNNNYLAHYGVLGMKWGRGKAKNQYTSTSIRAAIAKRKNAKVDKGFEDWEINDKKKKDAIELGKKANIAKIAYENNRSDRNLKSSYKTLNKEYGKALKQNTTYRKGVIRQEVGRDISRKYLSEAKKIKKQMDTDPSNGKLKKKYNGLMSKYDTERATARRAVEVSSKRMNRIRTLKSMGTKTVKGLAATAITGVGIAVVNKYIFKGKLNVKTEEVLKWAAKCKDFLGYFY